MTVEGKKDDAVGPDKGNKSPVVTVVLTPGRSGSSLLMEVLGNLGAGLSDELIAGRLENPHGFFEDARVVEIHKKLMSDLGARPGFPMPEGWLDQQVSRKAKRALTDLVRQQASAGPGGWAIKDPRISDLLPLWLQVFNSAGVTPRFILALRDPAVVATSLRRAYNQNERLGELLWLNRTTQALYHSAADCFVLHYEDWFERPGELAQGLAQYCDLGELTAEQAKQAVDAALEEKLDRSGWQDYEVRHPLVKRLYATLQPCRGADFNRAQVIEAVRDASDLIEGFSWWGRLHTGAGAKSAAAGTSGSDQKEAEEVLAYHKVLRQLKAREDEVAQLRARLFAHPSALQQPRAAKGADKQVAMPEPRGGKYSLKRSIRYRLGDILVKAVSSPGRNTVALPLRLARLGREGWRHWRSRRTKGERPAAIPRWTDADREVRSSFRYRLGDILVRSVVRPGWNTLAVPVRVIRLLRDTRSNQRTPRSAA